MGWLKIVLWGSLLNLFVSFGAEVTPVSSAGDVQTEIFLLGQIHDAARAKTQRTILSNQLKVLESEIHRNQEWYDMDKGLFDKNPKAVSEFEVKESEFRLKESVAQKEALSALSKAAEVDEKIQSVNLQFLRNKQVDTKALARLYEEYWKHRQVAAESERLRSEIEETYRDFVHTRTTSLHEKEAETTVRLLEVEHDLNRSTVLKGSAAAQALVAKDAGLEFSQHTAR